MTLLKLIKNNANPCRFAVLAPQFFDMKVALKQETTEAKKEWAASLCVKFKYPLHTQSFICFNLQLHGLKKNP